MVRTKGGLNKGSNEREPWIKISSARHIMRITFFYFLFFDKSSIKQMKNTIEVNSNRFYTYKIPYLQR